MITENIRISAQEGNETQKAIQGKLPFVAIFWDLECLINIPDQDKCKRNKAVHCCITFG